MVLVDNLDLECQLTSKEASISIQAIWVHQGKTKFQINYVDS